MKVGLLQFELRIPDAMSLKDKRRIVKSVKDKLHREHLVSVAEVGALEIWNCAIMGIAMVSNDGGYIHSVLSNIVSKLERWPGAELANYLIDVVDADQVDEGKTEDGQPLWTPEERREAS